MKRSIGLRILNVKSRRLPHPSKNGKYSRATWDLKQEYRRMLYSTVAEWMILHGAAAWTQNLTSRQKKLLQTIQRNFSYSSPKPIVPHQQLPFSL
ncbi:hypothetical protein AVEN_78064-1 [Araneus ventricosus]|uniref:Uncharacterized protein n=1 Tax=Araneus ventricosus TaxID=182803 RepID=A0A4Y2MYH1_ARAVE|nr:hypothetical protein AVEN_78064-1 [Araneus ventricosus]